MIDGVLEMFSQLFKMLPYLITIYFVFDFIGSLLFGKR